MPAVGRLDDFQFLRMDAQFFLGPHTATFSLNFSISASIASVTNWFEHRPHGTWTVTPHGQRIVMYPPMTIPRTSGGSGY